MYICILPRQPSGQFQDQHKYRMKDPKVSVNFTFKHDFLKMSTDLQISLVEYIFASIYWLQQPSGQFQHRYKTTNKQTKQTNSMV
jgi:hypothetical protein